MTSVEGQAREKERTGEDDSRAIKTESLSELDKGNQEDGQVDLARHATERLLLFLSRIVGTAFDDGVRWISGRQRAALDDKVAFLLVD